MGNSNDQRAMGVGSGRGLTKDEAKEFYGLVAKALEALDELWKRADSLTDEVRRLVREARDWLLQVDPKRPGDHQQHRLRVEYAYYSVRRVYNGSYFFSANLAQLTREAIMDLGRALDAVNGNAMSVAANGG